MCLHIHTTNILLRVSLMWAWSFEIGGFYSLDSNSSSISSCGKVNSFFISILKFRQLLSHFHIVQWDFFFFSSKSLSVLLCSVCARASFEHIENLSQLSFRLLVEILSFAIANRLNQAPNSWYSLFFRKWDYISNSTAELS